MARIATRIIGAGSWLTIVFLRNEFSFSQALERIKKPAASVNARQRAFSLYFKLCTWCFELGPWGLVF